MVSVDELAAEWRRTIAEHPRRWCPRCKRRRCWPQAEARAALIIRGEPLTLAGR